MHFYMKDREVTNLQEIFSEVGFLIIYAVINYRLLVLGWRFAKTSVTRFIKNTLISYKSSNYFKKRLTYFENLV